MRTGYRVVEYADIGVWDGQMVQVSIYRNWGGSVELAHRLVEQTLKAGLAHVLHPVGYSLLDKQDVGFIRSMLALSGEALILHDERGPGGERLAGKSLSRYEEGLASLREGSMVSIENSEHSADAPWFWRRMGGSVTLDIGHMESFGLDSVEFIKELSGDIIERVDYVHMHHNNGLHGGITDHWPLSPGCRELRALEALLKRRSGLGVILEINEREEMDGSLRLIGELRERVVR
jgi:hypothetical protein